MFIIPDFLKSVLRQGDYGALTTADDRGQVHVLIKLQDRNVKLSEGPLPIIHFVFMFPMPTAPVVGWIIEIVDNPHRPLKADIYFNILDLKQVKNLRRLACQRFVSLHFVQGDSLSIVVTKRIKPPRDIPKVLQEATDYASQISRNHYDFDAAKLAFKAQYSLADMDQWWLF